MHGSQCDTCREFTVAMSEGWMTLNRLVTFDNGGFTGEAMQTVGTFCSVKCLSEYSYVVLATENAPNSSAG